MKSKEELRLKAEEFANKERGVYKYLDANGKCENLALRQGYEQGYNDRTTEYGGVTPEQVEQVRVFLSQMRYVHVGVIWLARRDAEELLQSLTPKT